MTIAAHPRTTSLTRRAALGGLAATLLVAPATPAQAFVRVELSTNTTANRRVRVTLRIWGELRDLTIPVTAIGPIYVPRDGRELTRSFTVADLKVMITAVIIGPIITVVTRGVSSKTEVFRRLITRRVGIG